MDPVLPGSQDDSLRKAWSTSELMFMCGLSSRGSWGSLSLHSPNHILACHTWSGTVLVCEEPMVPRQCPVGMCLGTVRVRRGQVGKSLGVNKEQQQVHVARCLWSGSGRL